MRQRHTEPTSFPSWISTAKSRRYCSHPFAQPTNLAQGSAVQNLKQGAGGSQYQDRIMTFTLSYLPTAIVIVPPSSSVPRRISSISGALVWVLSSDNSSDTPGCQEDFVLSPLCNVNRCHSTLIWFRENYLLVPYFQDFWLNSWPRRTAARSKYIQDVNYFVPYLIIACSYPSQALATGEAFPIRFQNPTYK